MAEVLHSVPEKPCYLILYFQFFLLKTTKIGINIGSWREPTSTARLGLGRGSGLLPCPVCLQTHMGETKGALKCKGVIQMSLIKKELVPCEVVLRNPRLFCEPGEGCAAGPGAAAHGRPAPLSMQLKCSAGFRMVASSCVPQPQFPISIPQLCGNPNFKTLICLNRCYFFN